MTASRPPDLSLLAQALGTAAPLLARVDDARHGTVSGQGGDVGAHGRTRLVTRHVANYLAAVDLARREPVPGVVVDVGSGVGALGAWAALELGARLYLVDSDRTARTVAASAFPEATVAIDAGQVPTGSARLVTAMEVIEHVPPREQAAFVRGLAELLVPGGILALSTPDESRYVGGWSGYRPHVGPLAYDELAALLGRNTPWPFAVWRLEGEPFELGRVRAAAEPVVNRVWGWCEHRAPGTAARAAAAAGRLGRVRRRPRGTAEQPEPVVSATADPGGGGTGLLGVVQRPHE